MKMIFPDAMVEKSVEELMKECVKLQSHIKGKTLELEDLKTKIDKLIPEDKYVIDGVAVFKRSAGSVRKNFDKEVAKGYLTQEQFDSCIKETQVKPSISIISWENNEIRKSIVRKKEGQ